MKYSKLVLIVFVVSILVSSCKEHQGARRPISQASGTFMKKSIERNKKLISGEEAQINAVIKKNSKVKFIPSTKGYWYAYSIQNQLDTITPKKGDVAYFDYEIKDLKGNIIYSELESRPQTYYVDKQNIMMGLRDGIKLMHKTEKVHFLFPSHMAYGFHGDDKKIGPNIPILCTVTLRDFKSEKELKRQTLKPVTTVTPVIEKQITVENKPEDTLK